MRHEVALLVWNDGSGGESVRIVGRSVNEELVEIVRGHLVRSLADAGGVATSRGPDLHLITGRDRDQGSGTGTTTDTPDGAQR